MRLIDADALADASCSGGVCAECDDMHGGNNVVANCSEVRFHFLKFIKDAPTIEERKIGRWLHTRVSYEQSVTGYFLLSSCECSECGVICEQESNFCPNCGADMRRTKFDGKKGQT